MYGLVLTLVLMQAAPARGQEPPAVLFVEQGRALPGKQGQGLATRVSALLERERLSLVVSAEQGAACRGERSCLARLGHTLGAALVVRMEAEALADTLGLHLEAVSTPGGEVVLETAFVVDPGGTENLEAEVSRFARRVHALLESHESGEPPSDVPLAGPLLSPPASPPLPVREPPPALPAAVLASGTVRPSLTLAHATGGGALVTAGAALSLWLVGVNAKARLEDAASLHPKTSAPVSALPRSEAERLVQRANLSFTLALSSAVLSAALGTVSALVWSQAAVVAPRQSP